MQFGGGAKKCPRCDKTVYHAEQALGPQGKPWHKLCLRCQDCGHGVDSTTMSDRDGEVFCKTCYGKRFGPKGYGFGGGAGTLTDTGKNVAPVNESRPTFGAKEPGVAQPVASSVADRSAAFTEKQKEPVPANKPVFGGGSQCPRCGKSVFYAEKAMGPNRTAYHKMCLRCVECNKMVDSSTMADHDGVLYCKGCHGKKFGPKGYGYGGGAGTLTHTK